MATTQELLDKARAVPKPYTVGNNYTVDTSAYAGKTDENSVALQAQDRILNAYKSALQSSYDSQAAANVAAANKLKAQYDASRSNVYTNNRLSAIGNNERLAALGLAGNLYDYSRSGTSESSRIAQDINMRKSLAALDQSENETYNDYQLALMQAQKEADANFANKAAEVEAAKVPYQMALAQAQASLSSGGGGRSYTPTASSSKKTKNPQPIDEDTYTGTASSVHNAIVANKNKGYLAAKAAAEAELATIKNTSEKVKAAEQASKLLDQLRVGKGTNANR